MQDTHGWTLIELLIVLALGAILAALATPSLRRMAARNSLATATNDLAGSIRLARISAIDKGRSVSLCAGNIRAGCTGHWSEGSWLVFVDADRDGQPDEEEALLRQTSADTSNLLRLDGNGPFRQTVVFGPLGIPRRLSGAFAAGSLRVCMPLDGMDNAVKIIMSISGRLRTHRLNLDGECPPL